MTDRNRAWRRRQSRLIEAKVQQSKDWLKRQFAADKGTSPAGEKRHRPGKLTHVQQLRSDWSTYQQLADGM